jgi:FSR family fosmidomycin resistance protein-like MFS transporter
MALASILSTRRRGLTMGLFSASGSIGVSLGPVLALTLVGAYGLDKSYFGAVPALLLFPLLWKFGPWRTRLDVSDNRGNAIKELRAKWRPLSAVLAIGLLRSWVGSTFYSFVGVYLTDVRSWSIGPVKWALSFYLIAEGIGCLLGGFMSDRIGRRAVVVAGHLLSLPALFMLIRSDGSILWLSLALSSAFLNLCQPVLLVMAQEVCPEAVATAAGLTGTAEAIGGLLVAVSGYLADVYSLETALSISAVVLLAPALIAVVAPIKAQGDTAASCTR